MKEEFCSLEISLKLKELGFDEECFGYYLLNKENILVHSKNAWFKAIDSNSLINKIPAPLWQQAISFLKEKNVLITETWDGWEYGAWEWDNFIFCETKEEAFLKAIELWKKNS